MVENATRKAWVLASDQILEELQKDWSPPVQAHATANPDGSWDMTFRTYNQPERRVVNAAQALMRQSDVMMEHNGVHYLIVTPREIHELREALNAVKAGSQ